MQVRDVMTRQVECVLSTGTLAEAARKMKERDIGFVPVIDKGETVGLVTDRDIAVRAIAEGRDPNATPVSDVMSRDVVWIDADDDVSRAAELMRERKVRRLLVRERDRQLAGVLSLGDMAERDERTAARVLQTIFEAP